MSRMMRGILVGAVLAAVTGVAAAHADEGDAKKYIEQAQADAKDEKYSSVDTDLQLAEAEIDDLPADKKKPLETQVAEIRHEIAVTRGAAQKDEITKLVASELVTLKADLDGDNNIADGIKELDALMSKPETKIALGDAEYAKTRKQMATFLKVNSLKQSAKAMERASAKLDDLEKGFPDVLKGLVTDDYDRFARDYSRDADIVEATIAFLPEDKPEAKALADRYKKMNDQFNEAYGKVLSAEFCKRKKEYWESYKDEYEGWDKETTGTTFNAMLHRQDDANSRVGCPKSAALITRANDVLGGFAEDENYKYVKDNAAVKELIASIAKQRDDCQTKIAKFADAILTEVEKMKLNQESRDRLETFVNDDLRLSLDGYPKLLALQARGRAMVDKYDAETIGAQKAAEKLEKDLTDQAKDRWPAIEQKYKINGDFDPVNARASKGTTIKLEKVQNRMGWDFKPGDFDFAVTIHGVPIAGRYDPAVKAVIADVLKRTKKDDLPEENYDVIAVVEGTGRLTQLVRSEAEGKIEDLSVKAKVTEEIPVDAPIIRIVALHVGPVAASVK